MNAVLARWNGLDAKEAMEEILSCCGSKTWAKRMVSRRPILGEAALLAACDEVCNTLSESDWDDAFRSHPRVGESASNTAVPARSAVWSGEEQQKVDSASDDVRTALAEGNRAYEQRFQRIFIVCATGKSASEILGILQRRLRNAGSMEALEAAGEQRKITQLRLKKWLAT
jgi:2-oxo-4-hydroxy-4-carboxy-5-ureidoimidazoline decarboxylase